MLPQQKSFPIFPEFPILKNDKTIDLESTQVNVWKIPNQSYQSISMVTFETFGVKFIASI